MQWLDDHVPDRAARVRARIRETQGGRAYDPAFGTRMRGEGAMAEQVGQVFEVFRRKHNLDRQLPPLTGDAFRRPAQAGQMRLFG